VALASGAAMRRTGPADGPAVICLNGGVGRALEGDWSTSVDWLVRRLAPLFPELAFYEVRYRIRSWKHLDRCIEDARAALAAVAEAHPPRAALVGYSMGGAVCLAVADDPLVTTFIGLAPWLPREMGVEGVAGRRVAVIHGSLDGRLLFGVSPSESRRGVERMRASGVDASYTLVAGGLHAMALSGPGDRLIRLPRAGAWARLLGVELRRFQAEG
jgi:pimeloyl-ACP methyl ester carboxylesterase